MNPLLDLFKVSMSGYLVWARGIVDEWIIGELGVVVAEGRIVGTVRTVVLMIKDRDRKQI